MSRLIIIVFFFGIQNLLGQHPFQKGFDLLEAQDYDNAKTFFSDILHTSPEDKTANICFGRALGLGGESEEALHHFSNMRQTWIDDLEVELNYGEALLWNKQPEEARVIYEELLSANPSHYVINYGLASTYAELKEYEEASEFINKAIAIDPSNESATFSRMHIWLGRSFSLFTKRQFEEAKQWADSVRHYYPENKNALEIQELIDLNTSNYVDSHYYFTDDNAENQTTAIQVNAKINITNKHLFNVQLENRDVSNSNTNQRSGQRSILINDNWFLNEKTSLQLGVGVFNNSVDDQQNQLNLRYLGGLTHRATDYLFFEFKYQANPHNYTSDLIESGIVMHDLQLVSHITLPLSFGLYGSVLQTFQTDSNQRTQFFISAYQHIKNIGLKAGINYTSLSFKEDRSFLYFSPDKYQNGELFLEWIKNDFKVPASIKLFGAYGFQQINGGDRQPARRLELVLAYEIVNNFTLQLGYKFSNTAQSNAVGEFSFNQWHIGASFKY